MQTVRDNESYIFDDHPYSHGALIPSSQLSAITVKLCRHCAARATYPLIDRCVRCESKLRRRGARRTRIKQGMPWNWRQAR
jgi:hypothetical protein